MKYHGSIKIITMVGLIVFIAATSLGFAQSTIKIGIVDVRKVYDNWDEKKKIDNQFEPKRATLKAKQKTIEDTQADLESKRSIKTSEQIKAEEQKIKKMKEELDKSFRELVKEIDAQAEELSKKLDTLMDAAYANLSKNEGYTLILDSRFVRYSIGGMDLTNKVSDYVNSGGKK